MTDQSTHAPSCWGWGPKHYECALREIDLLVAERKRVTAAQGEAKARAERLEKILGAYQAAVNKIDDLIEYSLPMPPETKAALYAILEDLTAALSKENTSD